MKRNPVLVILGGVGPVLIAGTALLVNVFHLSQTQVESVVGFISAVVMLLLALITRQMVTPYDPAVNNTVDASFVTKAALDAVTDPVTLVREALGQLTKSADSRKVVR